MIDISDNAMMRRADKYTIDNLNISGEELMRRAASGIFEEISRLNKKKVAIIAGKGNNGGDGICVAMLMIENGELPDIYLFSRDFSHESAFYYDKIKNYGNIYDITGEEDYSEYDVILDAMFGTGLSKRIEGVYLKTVKNINRSGAYVVSADIPSGLNGDNGLIMGDAVKADMTVSVNTIKAGLILANGKDYCGRIVNKNIGIVHIDKTYKLLEDSDILLPQRVNNSHKNTYGNVAIIGGCTNYIGATKLSYMGADSLMSGAGIVRLCVPDKHVGAVMSNVIEQTVYPLKDRDGHIRFDEDNIRPLLEMSCIAFGMGIGQSNDVFTTLKYIVKNYKGRLLIDADGLNALSENPEILKDAGCSIVITPHVKEMSRLTGTTVNEILADPVKIALEFANEYAICVLLKGTSTIVTDGNDVNIINRGASSMAKGGSGDVLSGVIAGLLANSKLGCYDALSYGAYIAGVAGEMARNEYGEYGALPRDTARYVAYAIKDIMNKNMDKY